MRLNARSSVIFLLGADVLGPNESSASSPGVDVDAARVTRRASSKRVVRVVIRRPRRVGRCVVVDARDVKTDEQSIISVEAVRCEDTHFDIGFGLLVNSTTTL